MNEAMRSSDKSPRPARGAPRLAAPIGLIVLAVVGSAYAYLVDRESVSDADRAARPNDVFPSFRLDAVRHVKLIQGPDELLLERDAEDSPTWTVTSRGRPEKEAADPAAVDVLLRELELARRVREVSDGQGTGLDTPRVRGQIAVGRLKYAFALGADAATPPGSAYMNLEGEGAFVVGSTLKVQLLRGADAYRERSIVSYAASDVARIEVISRAGAFSIERAGQTFRLGGPRGLRASRTLVDRLFSGLAEARADLFVDDQAADRQAAPPALTVTVVPRQAGRPRVRFEVRGACPGRPRDVIVDRTEPTRTCACVTQEATDAMAGSDDSLVDRGVLFAHADEIEELRLESLAAGAVRVEIARLGTGWHERSPEPRDLDPDEADSANLLAAALADAQAVDVRPLSSGDRFAVHTRATIIRTGAAATEVIEIAAPDKDGSALARRLDDGAVLRLPRAVARRFDPHPIALRARALWPAGLDAANIVSISDSCGPSPERVDLQGGRWILRAHPEPAADSAAVTELASAFVRAKAQAWLSDDDDGSYGFGRAPSCTVSLAMDPAGAPRQGPSIGITFGAQTDDGYYARTLDRQAVFIAPATLHNLAIHPPIDRSRFRLDPARLVRVRVVRGGTALSLKNTGGHLVVTGGGATDSDGAADKLEAALSAFRARDALHHGAALQSEGFDHPTLEIDAVSRSPSAYENGSAAGLDTRIVVGAPGQDDGAETYFARVFGIEATFAVPRENVDAFLAIVGSQSP